MTALDVLAAGSPLDVIRQVDVDGREYWSARDLMGLLGYDKWERFEDAIDRAKASAENVQIQVADHFPGAGKVIKGGRWGEQNITDYLLTRYACYLVAMNGDPRKKQIAEAQTYFAVRTREAEIARGTDPVPPRELSRRDLALMVVAAEEEKEVLTARVADLVPLADLAERYLSVPTGGRIVGEVAKSLGWSPSGLRSLLQERGIIFRRTADCGRRYWDAKAEYFKGQRPKFRAQEVVVTHEHRHDPDEECLHYTLYVLQPGVELILRLIRQAEGGAR